MPRRRGDNIPPVSAYKHWNEDAYYMWYEENKYDMMYADEIIEDDDDDPRDYYEPDPDIDESFDTEEEAQAFMDSNANGTAESLSMSRLEYSDGFRWLVEGFSKDLHKKHLQGRNRGY